jgi:hypothetical protein
MPDLRIPKIAFEVSDDASCGTIRVGDETIVADAANVEALIANLGLLRAQLAPPVAAAMPTDRRVFSVDGPAVDVRETPENGCIAFAFRSPAHGWLRFNVPLAQAAAIGRHLADHVLPRFARPDDKE